MGAVDRSLEKRLRRRDFGRIKLYQDTEVMGGIEGWRVTEEMAKHPDGFNDRILLKLRDRWGAELMSTEMGEELREELLDEWMKKLPPLEARDLYIASRDLCIAHEISHSLDEGELGILFIGVDHHVEGWKEFLGNINIEDLVKKEASITNALIEVFKTLYPKSWREKVANCGIR